MTTEHHVTSTRLGRCITCGRKVAADPNDPFGNVHAEPTITVPAHDKIAKFNARMGLFLGVVAGFWLGALTVVLVAGVRW